jgi:hypothetical protein
MSKICPKLARDTKVNDHNSLNATMSRTVRFLRRLKHALWDSTLPLENPPEYVLGVSVSVCIYICACACVCVCVCRSRPKTRQRICVMLRVLMMFTVVILSFSIFVSVCLIVCLCLSVRISLLITAQLRRAHEVRVPVDRPAQSQPARTSLAAVLARVRRLVVHHDGYVAQCGSV